MTADQYEIVNDNVTSEADAPRAKDVFYRCDNCGELVPSQPDDNVGCKCGNIFVDVDYLRLVVEDFRKFKVVRKLPGKRRK